MIRQFHFDVPPGGLDANMDVFQQAEANAAASPLDETAFRFLQHGTQELVVEYDGPAAEQAIVNAVENVYGVTHRRTREVGA